MIDGIQQFQPGRRYRFRPKPGKSHQKLAVIDYHARTLTYLWDAPGDHVVHHVFQLRGGALECFSDVQVGDYNITEM